MTVYRRVAVISHWGFRSLHGGNLRAFFLVRELLAQGIEVTVLLANDDDVDHTRNLFGCSAVSVNEPMSRWQSVGKKLVQYVVFGRKIRKLLERSDFDAVFGVNLVQALPAVRQRRSESWVTYVDLWADFFAYDSKPTLKNRLFSKAIRAAEFYTMRKAQKLVTITRCMRDLCPPSLRHRIAVIPDGADTRRFTPELEPLERERFGLHDGPVFSYQGGIARHEGLDLLCRAAPHVLEILPEAQFLIVGRGDFLEECQRLVTENGSHASFRFTGWVDYSEMPRLLRSVDVSVVPMPDVRAARPIISFKLLEAMAAGTLIVTNRLPGLSEIVDDSMVVMTHADDEKVFAADLVRAYELPAWEKAHRTENAVRRVRDLDWREIARREAGYFASTHPEPARMAATPSRT